MYLTFQYDGAYLNGLLIVPAWGNYFNHPAGQTLGLVTASFYFRTLVSASSSGLTALAKIIMPPVAGWVSDKYGRRAGLMLGSIITLAGGLLGAFSRDLGMFIGGRVLVGAGQACHQAIAPPLLQEFAHPVGFVAIETNFSVFEVFVVQCTWVYSSLVASYPPFSPWE